MGSNLSSTPPPVTEEMIEAGCEAMHKMSDEMLARERSETPEDMPDYDEGDLCRVIIEAALAARSNQEATPERLVKDSFDPDGDGDGGELMVLAEPRDQEATRTVGDAEVEAVAKAICEASGDLWKTGTYEVMSGPNFEVEDHPLDPFNNHWRFLARAAIDALSHTSSCGGND